MLIRVVRSGGFAGISRRAEVDTGGQPDAASWHRLAETALGDGERPDPRARLQADRFQYRIEVDGQILELGESQLSEAQRELVERVLASGG